MCERSTISNFLVPDQVVNNRESAKFFWSTLMKTRHVMSGCVCVCVCRSTCLYTVIYFSEKKHINLFSVFV